jgi:IMP dehydrogenase
MRFKMLTKYDTVLEKKYPQALAFDDITIKPRKSRLESRGDCITKTPLTRHTWLDIPVIGSPMDTVTEWKMAKTLGELGGIGFIHRFMSIEDQAGQIELAHHEAESDILVGGTIGATKDYLERAHELKNAGASVILIDVAHGDSHLVFNALEILKKEIDIDVIAGSVSTYQGTLNLLNHGADGIRVGQGNGSLCETRIKTGCGVPQVTALIEAQRALASYNERTTGSVFSGKNSPTIISCGGIRVPGDLAKALVVGADTVILGSLLAGTKETPGDIMRMGDWPNEQLFKQYRGSASIESKRARGEVENNIEGNSKLIPYKGKTKRIIDDLMDGLKSAMSYSGAKDMRVFKEFSQFYTVTNAGLQESQPHLRR